MHSIEPNYRWRNLYQAKLDPKSPFYGYENSEVYFTDKIYDHLIHPQWDNFGAETLFIKQLYTDYNEGVVVLEFIGEWNDVLHNDIMTLKRDVLEPIMEEGITEFILCFEHVLNFHADHLDYYEEWVDEIEDGFIAVVNARPHVYQELSNYNVDQYLIIGEDLNNLEWANKKPSYLIRQVKELSLKRLT